MAQPRLLVCGLKHFALLASLKTDKKDSSDAKEREAEAKRRAEEAERAKAAAEKAAAEGAAEKKLQDSIPAELALTQTTNFDGSSGQVSSWPMFFGL